MIHKPVLVKEVLELLNVKPDENVIDGTVGQGGHAALILEKTGPNGKLLGIDADAGQIENAKRNLARFGERVTLVNDSYGNIAEIVQQNNVEPVNAVLLDLGYSSWQLENSGKGFSFQKDEPLDMRYGSGELTAKKIVNEWPQEKLQEIIEEFGEEKFARRIAEGIVRQRKVKKITTTFELKEVVEKIVLRREKIHPATRTFQALRIAVNDELGTVQQGLEGALSVLSSGGRLVVISFHSLEDRIVKNVSKTHPELVVLTKKPITASEQEMVTNPRSRSAKVRAIQKP